MTSSRLSIISLGWRSATSRGTACLRRCSRFFCEQRFERVDFQIAFSQQALEPAILFLELLEALVVRPIHALAFLATVTPPATAVHLIAAHAAHFGIREIARQHAQRLRVELRVGIGEHQDLPARALHRDLIARGYDVGELQGAERGVDEFYMRDPDGYELGFATMLPAQAGASV